MSSEFERHTDVVTGRPYWHNARTKVTTWSPPPQAASVAAPATTDERIPQAATSPQTLHAPPPNANASSGRIVLQTGEQGQFSSEDKVYLLFAHYDKDCDGVWSFAEARGVMPHLTEAAYDTMCRDMKCVGDGLTHRDVADMYLAAPTLDALERDFAPVLQHITPELPSHLMHGGASFRTAGGASASMALLPPSSPKTATAGPRRASYTSSAPRSVDARGAASLRGNSMGVLIGESDGEGSTDEESEKPGRVLAGEERAPERQGTILSGPGTSRSPQKKKAVRSVRRADKEPRRTSRSALGAAAGGPPPPSLPAPNGEFTSSEGALVDYYNALLFQSYVQQEQLKYMSWDAMREATKLSLGEKLPAVAVTAASQEDAAGAGAGPRAAASGVGLAPGLALDLPTAHSFYVDDVVGSPRSLSTLPQPGMARGASLFEPAPLLTRQSSNTPLTYETPQVERMASYHHNANALQ